MILSIETVSTARAHLWEAGFRPVPIINWDAKGPSPGKRPLGDNWRESALKDPPFCVTIPAVSFALNTGVLGDGLRPIDIDIDDPILAARVQNLAVKRFGPMPTRTRANSARALLLCRAASGQPRKIAVTGATHTRERGCKVEVLGAGQQFVALGRHDSGAELLWQPPIEEITLADLPAITEPDIMAYLAEVAIIIDATPPGYTNGRDHYDATEPQADALRVIAALAAIPNNGPADWEGWNRIGMAIWAATGGSAIGGEAFNEWSRRHPAYDAAATEERWRHYQRSPPTQIGAGTLFHMAGGTFQPEPELPEPPPPIEDPGYFNSVAMDAPLPGPTEATARTVFDPWNTLRPVAFPINTLPERLRAFVLSRATTIGADPCAIAWACLSACSAAIHGETRLRMKRHDYWTVAPALWVALIGAPSTKKSPIIEAAWAPVSRVQHNDLKQYQGELARWKALSKKDRDETPEPDKPRRLISHDGTMEALQEILARQARGIGVLRDELAGWIGSMEKYAPGKGGAADRAFWLQAYNGGAHVVDRVMRGTVAIDNLLVTLCGGIQPERLRHFGDLTDDGLWQRFIPVIVAPASMGTDETPDRTANDYNDIVRDLIDGTATELRLSASAHAIRDDMQTRIHKLEQSEALGARFCGFVGKMPGVWGRLCIVLHLVAGERGEVSEKTAFNAHRLLFQSILPNAARVYTTMGGAGADIEATRSIAGYILSKERRRIVLSDLTNNVRVCRHKTVEDIRKLLSPLEAGGWLGPEKEFAPTSWKVNETVHEFFAHQADIERERRAMVRSLITGTIDL